MNLAGTSTLTVDQYTDAIVNAFETWTGVDCGGGNPPNIDFRQLRDVSCAMSEFNASGPNVNVVYFDDDGWAASQGDIDTTLALTTVNFDAWGYIQDADIAINSARHDFTVGDDHVEYDLQSIVTHEVGHFLGLAHSPRPDAVMYFSYVPGTMKRVLTDDDIQAVCTVYPPGRVAVCDPIPHGGLEDSCGRGATPSPGCSFSKDRVGTQEEFVLPLVLGMAALAGARRCIRHRARP